MTHADNSNERGTNRPGTTAIAPPAQRGALLILLVLIGLAIAGIFASIYALKLSRDIKETELVRRRGYTVKCNKAIREVIDAMEVEKKIKGEYPYEFDDEFLNRHRTLDRYIYNKEIWSRHADSELKLDTAFGTNYTLKGYCRDNNVYIYDSDDGEIDSYSYTPADLKE